MPPEFGRKWGTECLNTRLPLPTLLCARNSVKLIFKKIINIVGNFIFFKAKRIGYAERKRIPRRQLLAAWRMTAQYAFTDIIRLC